MSDKKEAWKLLRKAYALEKKHKGLVRVHGNGIAEQTGAHASWVSGALKKLRKGEK